MSHHAPFKALCPVDWDSVANGSIPDLLRTTFSDAQTIIDSIPLPKGVASAVHGSGGSGHGRARAKTDPSGGGGASVALNRTLSPGSSGGGGCAQTAKLLHKEWKEVKTNPRDNPLAINVYKLSAKDGKGAWFARRGIHEGVSFDKFRLGLEREFAEALKTRRAQPDAGPGAGNVRGIGAEKRTECTAVDGVGKVEVYQLSAQFPGPTTPRDFIALLLTSAPDDASSEKKHRGPRAPRQFMIVSKPCVHPECSPRQGFIRGQYESVEIIREVPVEVPLRKVRSSIDLNREDIGDLSKAEQVALGKEAVIQSARRAAGNASDDGGDDDDDARSTRSDVGTIKEVDADIGAGHETSMAVEWLMVTRSDPGGSVPRFMVEKGTPAGIVSDAGRFLDWLSKKNLEELAKEPEIEVANEEAEVDTDEVEAQNIQDDKPEPALDSIAEARSENKHNAPTANLVPDPHAQAEDVPPVAPASGLYGMITGAIGVAGSVVASRIPNRFGGSLRATDSEPDDLDGRDEDDTADSSDTSSIRSFNSAMESPEHPLEEVTSLDSSSAITGITSTETLKKATPSSYSKDSKESESTLPSRAALNHEKDLKKLHERRRKVQEKMARLQERSLNKRQEDRDKDEQAMAKLREKHERDVARQEEKYQRELRKIEERRAAEERKAAERRRKQIEREEKGNIALELEHTRAELEVALKQVDLLKDQIGELQSQNTMLVATLGKHGLLKGGGVEALTDLKRNRSVSSASAKSASGRM